MSGHEFVPSCTLPVRRHSTVQLAHGGGGRLMRELIEELFLPRFASGRPSRRHDSAVVELGAGRIAFTTDSYVVHPLFFRGGNIGSLAVFGTVNDLAMAGAEPKFLSAGFILEEGFPIDALERIAESMRAAADAAGVELITGDTKVVDRGKADGLFVNTAGIGVVPAGLDIAPDRVRTGDTVILSGDVGRHGIAILSVREGLEFAVPIESDCAPLSESVRALVRAGVEVHCLRDLTRGGLASALNEIALDGGIEITIDEESIPVLEPVAGACELLGLDPLYVANEGRFIAFVPESEAERALNALRAVPVSQGAVLVGRVVDRGSGRVVSRNRIGGTRLLDFLSGEQLPDLLREISMHEWALAEAVVAAAAQIADGRGIDRVSEIRLRLGEAQRIDRDSFKSSLREILEHGAPRLRGARTEIETESARFRCRLCASEWGLDLILNTLNEEEAEAVHFIPEMARVYARCPGCSSPDFDLVAGRGIWLVSVTAGS